METRKVTTTIRIDATAEEVWKTITNKERVKKYFFGTNVDSEWKKGSPIIYSGTWEEKEYSDKGKILEIEKNKFLQHTHWSSLSGTPDIPENYYTVSYTLDEKGDHSILTVTQEGLMSEKSAEHSGKNWEMVLEKLKEVAEQQFSPTH